MMSEARVKLFSASLIFIFFSLPAQALKIGIEPSAGMSAGRFSQSYTPSLGSAEFKDSGPATGPVFSLRAGIEIQKRFILGTEATFGLIKQNLTNSFSGVEEKISTQQFGMGPSLTFLFPASRLRAWVTFYVNESFSEGGSDQEGSALKLGGGYRLNKWVSLNLEVFFHNLTRENAEGEGSFEFPRVIGTGGRMEKPVFTTLAVSVSIPLML